MTIAREAGTVQVYRSHPNFWTTFQFILLKLHKAVFLKYLEDLLS